MKYRKKPVVIEAFQLNERGLVGEDWFWDAVSNNDIITHYFGKFHPEPAWCEIKTLEGTMVAKAGDYIIRGVNGEIYPYKPDIFEQTYEQAGEWIPVSEELPEDDELVLVTVNDKHNNLTFENALMTGCYCCAEGWILEGYLDWIDPNVTAWLPLPEPYKEQNDDI